MLLQFFIRDGQIPFWLEWVIFGISDIAQKVPLFWIMVHIIYGYGWSIDRNQLIALAIPFAMWFCCMIASAITKGKQKILVVAIIAVLTYWGIYSYLYGQMFFNVDLVILASLTILSSLAMKQMDI